MKKPLFQKKPWNLSAASVVYSGKFDQILFHPLVLVAFRKISTSLLNFFFSLFRNCSFFAAVFFPRFLHFYCMFYYRHKTADATTIILRPFHETMSEPAVGHVFILPKNIRFDVVFTALCDTHVLIRQQGSLFWSDLIWCENSPWL